MNLNILIVDDEPGLRNGLKKILSLQGYDVLEASCINEAKDVLKKMNVDLIFLDLKLGNENGLEFLKKLKNEEPLIPVIIITGYGNIKNAVECLQEGAINYITKPIDKDLLLSVINKELNSIKLLKENIRLKESLEESLNITPLKSSNKKIKEINYIIEQVKDSPATILILGESGTGKEITAKYIHYSGIYKERPFVGINCAALNDNLLESELFGHEKGAFTGANFRKLGKFEYAQDGTLFLDEVGDMSLKMQAKLLRVLQEKSFERVGGTKSIHTNCRILAASNKDLINLMKKGEFREDLYYRLSLIVINLPPLRERKDDIENFIKLFIKQANIEYNKNVKSISKELLNKLINYPWTGNTRQLKNVITNAVILCNGEEIVNIDLLNHDECFDNLDIKTEYDLGLKQITSRYVEKFEKEIIIKVLKKYNRNLSKAASVLKITRKTLYEKIEKYSI